MEIFSKDLEEIIKDFRAKKSLFDLGNSRAGTTKPLKVKDEEAQQILGKVDLKKLGLLRK
jgi:hypothetical protein